MTNRTGNKRWESFQNEDIEESLGTLDELQNITDDFVRQANKTLKPKMNWKSFFQKLFEGVGEIDLNKKIWIGELQYLKEISLLLSKTSDEHLGGKTYSNMIIIYNIYNYCVFRNAVMVEGCKIQCVILN